MYKNELSALRRSDGFRGTSVLVIGDLMLDQYVTGEVSRISPEAPVPVLSVRARRVAAGGAANVALNAAGLGASVSIAGVVGHDAAGDSLLSILHARQISTSGVLRLDDRTTTSKTRVMCGSHQIVRFDDEVVTQLPSDRGANLLERVGELVGDTDVVILSDYNKGVLSEGLIASLIALCSSLNAPILGDPKKDTYQCYSGATCITPNLREFRIAARNLSIDITDFETAGERMRQMLGLPMLLVTQGDKGMTLFSPKRTKHLPALTQEVFDVSGAGDTVIATFATALGAGLSSIEAIETANLAASIVVQKIGTVPIKWIDLREILWVGPQRATTQIL